MAIYAHFDAAIYKQYENVSYFPCVINWFNVQHVQNLYGICELVREWKCIHVHRSIIELIFFKETGNRRSGYLILLIFGLQIIRAGFACLLLRIQYYYEVHKNITPFHFVITHKFIRMKCKNTSLWMLIHEFISWYMVWWIHKIAVYNTTHTF